MRQPLSPPRIIYPPFALQHSYDMVPHADEHQRREAVVSAVSVRMHFVEILPTGGDVVKRNVVYVAVAVVVALFDASQDAPHDLVFPVLEEQLRFRQDGTSEKQIGVAIG